jgi:hypothetical protein
VPTEGTRVGEGVLVEVVLVAVNVVPVVVVGAPRGKVVETVSIDVIAVVVDTPVVEDVGPGFDARQVLVPVPHV